MLPLKAAHTHTHTPYDAALPTMARSQTQETQTPATRPENERHTNSVNVLENDVPFQKGDFQVLCFPFLGKTGILYCFHWCLGNKPRFIGDNINSESYGRPYGKTGQEMMPGMVYQYQTW